MFVKALVFSILSTTAMPAAAAGELMLRINLPSYRLEVWDGGERIRSYPATIGAPSFPTPTGGYTITRIEWNPSWTPPDSRWARGKQKVGPGPSNPMGRVKLQFDRLLYVHGTSRTEQLGGAHSHGCIRLSNEDALDLARLVALRTGALSPEEIAALEANPRRTRSVRVPGGVPIRIRYGLSEDGDGGTVEHEDVYRWDDERLSGAVRERGGEASGWKRTAGARGFVFAEIAEKKVRGRPAPGMTPIQESER